jgi:hypothetical protein
LGGGVAGGHSRIKRIELANFHWWSERPSRGFAKFYLLFLGSKRFLSITNSPKKYLNILSDKFIIKIFLKYTIVVMLLTK